MHGLVRSSGMGSLLYIIPREAELATILSALITGDNAKLPSSITVSEISLQGDRAGSNGNATSETTNRPLPKLISHKHTPFLRGSRGLTICSVRLLADIVVHTPTALGDYKPIINFLCSNLDAAIVGRPTHVDPSTGRVDSITHGISHYGSLVGTIDRLDDDFIVCCLDLLTLFLRAHRSTHDAAIIANEKKRHALVRSFSVHQRGQMFSEKQKSKLDSVLTKAHAQTNILREIVCSKLMLLGDCVWTLGAAEFLRPILRLLVSILNTSYVKYIYIL